MAPRIKEAPGVLSSYFVGGADLVGTCWTLALGATRTYFDLYDATVGIIFLRNHNEFLRAQHMRSSLLSPAVTKLLLQCTKWCLTYHYFSS